MASNFNLCNLKTIKAPAYLYKYGHVSVCTNPIGRIPLGMVL